MHAQSNELLHVCTKITHCIHKVLCNFFITFKFLMKLKDI